MKTKLLIFEFESVFTKEEYVDTSLDLRACIYTNDKFKYGEIEHIADNVYAFTGSITFTEIYNFIAHDLIDYKKNIKNIYVMDGDLSSDAKDLIG
jgi:hypothetical protein